jgi:hypothetical protein
MKRKNRPAKKNSGSLAPLVEALVGEVQGNIQSGIQGADALLIKVQPLSPEEMKGLFQELLQKGNDQTFLLLEAICGKDERIDLALAESIGLWFSPRSADLLHRLSAATSSKAVAKSIRKSIFRLRSRGIETEEISDRAPAVYHPPQPAASEGFLTPIDSSGHRVVLLARPQIPQGMAAFSAAISDREGIVDFSGFETSRKNFYEYLEVFREQYPGEVVEADPHYCSGLIMEAAEIGQKKGTSPSPEFLKWRPLMGSSPSLPLRPLIYRYLEEGETKSRPELLDRSASLFQLSPFNAWSLEEEESRKYLALLKEASASRLVLAPHQKEGRIMEIYQQAVHDLFDGPRRLLYRRRLEEMAYILWKNGQENEARVALAAAAGMDKESGILAPHPFLMELVKRSLSSLLEGEKEEKGQEPGFIIKP